MPLNLLFTSSFYRSLKNFDPQQQQTVSEIIEALKFYYASGSDIAQAHKATPRFFYKKLRNDFYEAGVENKLRIILRKDGPHCSAVFAGNHDQIRKFLLG